MPSNLKRYPLNQSPLFKLKSRSKLAEILKLQNKQLRWLSKFSNELYKEKDRPKKDGSSLRHIEDPRRLLKQVQSRLASLLSRIEPPDFLFCPVKGRDYIKNAGQHRGNRVVRCLDIRKYFPSTSSRRVFWFFHTVLGCERDLAGVLTEISCFKGHLPTGSPLSPILSYFAHLDVWTAVANICTANDCTLTVYIDDVKVQCLRYPQCYITRLDSSTVPAYYHTTTTLKHSFTATSTTTCLSYYNFGIAKNTINISGTLYQDANGLKDNLVNGTAIGTVSGVTEYAYLIDSTG